ncbi:MAG TPA: aldo/keto reductase [archaeon]|nr:aldo/keto reductase [archaeon]
MPGRLDRFSARGALPRREFIKRASLAAVGAAAGLGAGPVKAQEAEPVTVNGLPGAVLGRTGLKVTRISFGGIMITEPRVLVRAIEQGINLAHLAPGYQDHRSLEAFGRALKNRRHKVIIAIKEWPEKIDASLKAMHTDYVDILVPPIQEINLVDNPAYQENFEKARQAGKVGFMGFACHKSMTGILDTARRNGSYDVVLLSYANADNPEFIASARAASQAGIGIMTMKGMPEKITLNSSTPDFETCAALCSAMVRRQHAHTVLASMGSFQVVDMFLDILRTHLGYVNTELERRFWASRKGRYCSMCGACTGVCPAGVEITRILRYRMYYRDYDLAGYARSCYGKLGDGSDGSACLECGRCEAICTRSLPIREMIREAYSTLA